MGTNIRIDELTLVASSERKRYPFSRGINVIHGETGSGKTSLLELIKYAFGGSGVLSPAVASGVRRVVLQAAVGRSTYRFVRDIGQTIVSVYEADGTLVEEFAVNQRKSMRRASDFLLEALGIPQLHLTSARPSGRSERMSFFDIYSYVYVPQSEIDRSIVGHLDPFRNRKRRATFELLLKLTDETISELNLELTEIDSHGAELARDLRAVTQFLAEAGLPAEEELIRSIELLEDEIATVDTQLHALRDELKRVTAVSATHQSKLSQLIVAQRDTHAQYRKTQAQLEERVDLRAQLEADLERVNRSAAATELLSGFHFEHCPRCLQPVEPDRLGANRCYVCGQTEDPVVDDDETARERARERNRIEELLAEVDRLDQSDRLELARISERQRVLEFQARELELEVDEETDDYVSPRYEAIASLSSRSGSLRSEHIRLTESVQFWARRSDIVSDMQELDRARQELLQRLQRAQTELEERRRSVVEVSDLFDEIVRSLGMPWYETEAYIDTETYLPMVNGVAPESLSSGGMKMMTNVAFHLALLTYSLTPVDTNIPNLLVIDSPRKNLGATDEDQAHAQAFYNWISTLVRAYTERSFQIIIADNDPPTPSSEIAQEIEVSHDNPSVPGVVHPGPSVEPLS